MMVGIRKLTKIPTATAAATILADELRPGRPEPRLFGVSRPRTTMQTIVLSFDIEEHHRIEAAHAANCSAELKADYAARMERVTYGLLDRLAAADAKATFYIVGRIAESHPKLVRAIAAAGHEVGSHSHAHQRIHRLTPQSFRDDLIASKDALEQVIGEAIHGFRAPTFSVTRETAWAIDVLAEVGFRYDSSIFPVRHDRYGVVDAPRSPFIVEGHERSMLELPPATLRLFGQNLPVAGGGYFRLFPPFLMRAGIRQLPSAMLYFHPWEFDADQPKLPLKKLSRWRTYVGIHKTTRRLDDLMKRFTFCRAIDLVQRLELRRDELPRFGLANGHKSVESPHLANVRE